jgi:hypothetical protein
MVCRQQVRALRHRVQYESSLLPRTHLRSVGHVASFKDVRRVVPPDTTWSGLTLDGSPLLMRDIGTEEVYALAFEAP